VVIEECTKTFACGHASFYVLDFLSVSVITGCICVMIKFKVTVYFYMCFMPASSLPDNLICFVLCAIADLVFRDPSVLGGVLEYFQGVVSSRQVHILCMFQFIYNCFHSHREKKLEKGFFGLGLK